MARAWQRFTLSWQLKQCNAEEGQMIHDPANVLAAQSPLDTKLRGLLGNVRIHHDHDRPPGVGHMGQSSSSGRFDPVVECVSCLRRSLVMVRNPAA
jgi:hypothetical protein